MKILMVSQFFDPEPQLKGLPFARELARLGHEVEVLTGFPNYPGGRIYDGYRVRPWQRENVDGVSILRVPLYPSHDRSVVRRTLNYSSFGLAAATLGATLTRKADVAYVYHPPGTIGGAAFVHRFLRRIPFVYDIQDLWPDALVSTGMVNSRPALWAIAQGCGAIYAAAAHVTVLSPGYKSALVARGVPAHKVSVIYNWCDEEAFRPTVPDATVARTFGMEGRFNVVFAGNVGPAQALHTVLSAAPQVARECPRVQFVLVGGGIEWEPLKQKAAAARLDNVRFLERMAPEKANDVLMLADVVLVHLKDNPLFQITIPSKTQAYLAAGRPILMAVRGDAADLVERAKAGVTCIPESAEDLTREVIRLESLPPTERARLGENGRRYYEQELSLRAGTERFVEVFRSAARRSTAQPSHGTADRRIWFLSSVGGGPIERLTQALSPTGSPVRLMTCFTPDRWRSLMAAGTVGRLLARVVTGLYYPAAVTLRTCRERPETVVPTTNPFYLPLLMVLSRRLHGARVVPLVYDLYPDAFAMTALHTLTSGLMNKLNRHWFARADGLVFIGERMAEHARSVHGEPKRWTVIETGADFAELDRTDSLPPNLELEHWCEGKTVVSYVGNMGWVHDWITLGNGIKLFLDGPLPAYPIGVVIAGSGPGMEYLQRRLVGYPSSRLRFEGPLSDDSWARLMVKTRVSLVSLRDEAAYTSIPSKAFSAMAAGNAVVAVAPGVSDLAMLIEDCRCGVVVRPGDAPGVAREIRRYATDPEALNAASVNARSAARSRYDIAVLAKRWAAWLSEDYATEGGSGQR